MFVFVVIAAIFTGLFTGTLVGEMINITSWMRAMKAGTTSGLICSALLAWRRQEIKKAKEEQEWQTENMRKMMQYMLNEKNEEIKEAVKDLRETDVDCAFCKHAFEDNRIVFSDCIAQEGCEECRLDCPCKGCTGRSKYEWRGASDASGEEEE